MTELFTKLDVDKSGILTRDPEFVLSLPVGPAGVQCLFGVICVTSAWLELPIRSRLSEGRPGGREGGKSGMEGRRAGGGGGTLESASNS